MTLNRDQLFADLDALTVEQIEAGLAAGVWGDGGSGLLQRQVRSDEAPECIRAPFHAAATASP